MKLPFERVVAAHGATVLRVCRAVVGVHDADDAWSETFLAAMRAYPELADDANVEAWLVTIAHRKAIDLTRMRARQAELVSQAVWAEQAGHRASGASDTIDPGGSEADDASELWRTVAALPEKQRLAVAYHFFGGLPFADVAELIGGSVEAARRASSDGVRALRRAYSIEAESVHQATRTKGQPR